MRRIAIAILFLVAAVALVLASPLFIPANFIKARMEAQLSRFIGRAVTIGGTPALSLYPQVAVTVTDLAIAGPDGPDGTDGDDALLEGAKLRAEMNAFALVFGQFRFERFDLTDPHIHLVIDADGRNNWTLSGSEIAGMASGAPPDDPGRGIGLGAMSIANGTVLFDDLRSTSRQELTGMDLTVDWPAAAESGSGSGSATWRGEPVEFSALVATPLDLLRGKPTGFRFGVASTPLRASLAGRLVAGASPRFDGSGTVSTPSLRSAFDWLGTTMGAGSILGAASAKGGVSWSGSAVSFSDASIELDGNEATGSLSADFAGERPKLSATLAFQSLDLSPYLDAARADLYAAGPWLLAPARLAFAEAIDADLHLSADQFITGATRTGKAALTATTNEGSIALKLEHAEFYGGTLSIDALAHTGEAGLAARAAVEVASSAAAWAMTDIAGISALEGTATVSFTLAGAGKSWGELARNVNGNGDVAITDGSLSGFDLGEDIAALSDPLAEPIAAGAEKTDFTAMGAHLVLHEGTITTGDLTMAGKGYALNLAGSGSVFGGAIAAEGRLSGGGNSIPIAVDGSWHEPTLARRQ